MAFNLDKILDPPDEDRFDYTSDSTENVFFMQILD
jgi:hypothetical protein